MKFLERKVNFLDDSSLNNGAALLCWEHCRMCETQGNGMCCHFENRD